MPGEFGHLRTDEAEMMRQRLTDELYVLSRRCRVPTVRRVRRLAVTGRRSARLLARLLARRRLGVEQLLQRPADVDDRQTSVEDDAERKHLTTREHRRRTERLDTQRDGDVIYR